MYGILCVGNKNTHKTCVFGCLLRLGFLRVFVCPVCFSVYGPFFHGSIKLDMSTLVYNILSLNISSNYIKGINAHLLDRNYEMR